MSMNEVVMEGISPTTNPENTFDLFPLSSLDFWTSLEKPVEATSELNPQAPSPFSKHPKRRSSQTSSKRRKCTKSTPPSPVFDFSALDCSDYWLRFDSDNDSIGQDPKVYRQDPPTSQPQKAASQQNTPSSSSSPSQQSQSVTLSTQAPASNKLAQGQATANNSTALKEEFWSPASGFLDDAIDGGLDYALSEEDDSITANKDSNSQNFMAEQNSAYPKGVSPNDSLYSKTSSASWESPAVPPLEQYFNSSAFPVLSDPEQRKLFAIAMGCGQTYPATTNGVGSPRVKRERTNSTTGSGVHKQQRQSSAGMATSSTSSKAAAAAAAAARESTSNSNKAKTADRAAHNDIERKYRTNLKDRITELRDAIPSLRSTGGDGLDNDEDDEEAAVTSSTPAKVSKGTILTKATEYIHQLERRNRSLNQRNEELSRRLQAFEQLLGAGAYPPAAAAAAVGASGGSSWQAAPPLNWK